MRLFVGISLPDEVSARLQAFVDRARPLARMSWTRAGDAHLTTKFLGNVADGDVVAVERALAAMPPRTVFPMTVRGVGWFPSARAPRVFWAGVDAPDDLAALAAATDDAVSAVGVPREGRPYVAHVTLARIAAGASLDGLRRSLAESPAPEFGSFEVDRFSLFEVRAGAPDGRYHVLASFSLRRRRP
jgi:2'-5' RNA ligase